MHKKSFTFGIGTGVLCLTVLLYFAYSVQIKKYDESYEKNLQKVLDAQKNEQTAEPLNDEELISIARQLGMVFPSEVEASPELQDPKDEPDAAKVELTDEEIIEKAKKLGMDFPVNPVNSDNGKPSATPQPNYNEGPSATPQPNYNEEPSVPPQSGSNGESVSVYVMQGSSARKIAQILFENGVVDNADLFCEYLYQTESTMSLRSGWFELKKGLSYDEVVRILLRK